MHASLQDNKFLLAFFFEERYLKLENVHNGEKCYMRNTFRMQNTAYKQHNLLMFRPPS